MKVLAGVLIMAVVFGPLVFAVAVLDRGLVIAATWWFTVAGAYWLGWDDGATSEKGHQAFKTIARHVGTREEG